MIEALQQFEPADALDVAIVAVGLYAGLIWLKRSQAALVALGFAMIGALYGVARLVGLELTTFALQGVFAALAVVLVVVFQDELRQALEELAAWVLGRRNDHRPRLDATEILVSALSRLAQNKVGALVVIPGIQKIDRHVSGGVELGGALSAPLLESLFDHHSPGHDGAVIVEDRSVARFGVQLPLTRNVEHLSGAGTRHSAALGLSEKSDALCLVVSEERGSVSAARDGRLEPVPNAQALASVLNRFYRKRRALSTPAPRMSRLLRERQAEKAASLVLAFVLWLLVIAGTGAPEPDAGPGLPAVAANQKR
jgi:uncharacterized protein (TIGR00159 family)